MDATWGEAMKQREALRIGIALAIGVTVAFPLGLMLGRGQPSPSGQSYFSYRVLRALSPDTLVAQLLAGLLAEGDRGGLAEQVARQTIRERLTALRAAIEAELGNADVLIHVEPEGSFHRPDRTDPLRYG